MGLGVVVLLGGGADVVPEVAACGVAVEIETAGEPGGDADDGDGGEDGVREGGDLADLGVYVSRVGRRLGGRQLAFFEKQQPTLTARDRMVKIPPIEAKAADGRMSTLSYWPRTSCSFWGFWLCPDLRNRTTVTMMRAKLINETKTETIRMSHREYRTQRRAWR